MYESYSTQKKEKTGITQKVCFHIECNNLTTFHLILWISPRDMLSKALVSDPLSGILYYIENNNLLRRQMMLSWKQKNTVEPNSYTAHRIQMPIKCHQNNITKRNVVRIIVVRIYDHHKTKNWFCNSHKHVKVFVHARYMDTYKNNLQSLHIK